MIIRLENGVASFAEKLVWESETTRIITNLKVKSLLLRSRIRRKAVTHSLHL
jgi:hypothetical protein